MCSCRWCVSHRPRPTHKVDELDEKIEQLKSEMRECEAKQEVEEEKRARTINDLKQQVVVVYVLHFNTLPCQQLLYACACHPSPFYLI